jgi:hypothetical protein
MPKSPPPRESRAEEDRSQSNNAAERHDIPTRAAAQDAPQKPPVLIATPTRPVAQRPMRVPDSERHISVRIGRIEIVAAEPAPPAARQPNRASRSTRPARRHQIDPRLPFAAGRW